ncbi:Barstar (barnase inhibitor) [Amycolatopsis arida]|uniref:Barstar (Barnase inhibitor) n=1 Tax=Amycolatopsis arida TaxID=587909 RepID=A0A1I5UVK1_9PSEU|nr:barstar family protein [Amycolatopsis arida]TDX91050.1 barstar (barnase inhibitor) [Amycolatopsis arida]SFP99273.1 Barstar (barnase inhibitor) [Amycolatopsis arida]
MSTVDTPNVSSIADGARARGAFPHVVNAGARPDKMSTLDAIAAAFSFPDWFGRNLDALYDMLTDLSWLPTGEHVLIWVDADALKRADPKGYLGIHGVLSDAQRATTHGADRSDLRRLTVVLTSGDGSAPE